MIKCPPSARLSTCACSGIDRRNAQIQPLVGLSSPFPSSFCLNTSNHILMQNRTLKQTRTGVIPSGKFAFNANLICAKILRRVGYERQAEVFVSHFKSSCVCFCQCPDDEVLPIDVAQRRKYKPKTQESDHWRRTKHPALFSLLRPKQSLKCSHAISLLFATRCKGCSGN